MPLKRKGLLEIGDWDVIILGPDLQVGGKASEFTVHPHDCSAAKKALDQAKTLAAVL